MSESDVPAEDVYVQELWAKLTTCCWAEFYDAPTNLADVFLLVISAEVSIWIMLATSPNSSSPFELIGCKPLNFCLHSSEHVSKLLS